MAETLICVRVKVAEGIQMSCIDDAETTTVFLICEQLRYLFLLYTLERALQMFTKVLES